MDAERFRWGLAEIQKAYPNTFLTLHTGVESRLLFFVADIRERQLVGVRLLETDFAQPVLRFENTSEKAHKLFGMTITCDHPTAKLPLYRLTVPVLPHNAIDAMVLPNGELIAKAHIGQGKVKVVRVHVNNNMAGIPNQITLYGVLPNGQTISQLLANPSITDYKTLC